MKNMKKLSATLISVTLILILIIPLAALPVSAYPPEGTVGKFTPQIDAEKDAAYDQSFKFNIFDQNNATKGEGWWSTYDNTSTNLDANIWFLWDDAFLYAFVDVLLPQVPDRGKDYITDDDNPWEANSAELWVLWTDLEDASERVKTSIDPLYNRTWGDGPYFDDIEPNTKKIAKLTPTGYCAEFAIAIPPSYLKDGGKLKFTLQINHYDGEGTIPVGQQIQGGGDDQDVEYAPILTLGAPIVIAAPAEPEPEPTQPEPEQPAAAAETPAATVAPAPAAPAPIVPATGDITVLMGVISLISAGGFAILRKKR